jgi:hypothetical protein
MVQTLSDDTATVIEESVSLEGTWTMVSQPASSLGESDLTATRERDALRRQVSDLNPVHATADGHFAR